MNNNNKNGSSGWQRKQKATNHYILPNPLTTFVIFSISSGQISRHLMNDEKKNREKRCVHLM